MALEGIPRVDRALGKLSERVSALEEAVRKQEKHEEALRKRVKEIEDALATAASRYARNG